MEKWRFGEKMIWFWEETFTQTIMLSAMFEDADYHATMAYEYVAYNVDCVMYDIAVNIKYAKYCVKTAFSSKKELENNQLYQAHKFFKERK